MERNVGLLVIGIGVAVAVVGTLIWSGALNWFGRLPGDIRIERGGARVFVPITSAIIASVVLTVVVNVIGRFLR